MKHTEQAKVLDPKTIAKQIQELVKKPLNKDGAKYYRRTLSHKKYKDTLTKYSKYNPEEYWENRAVLWSLQADDNYSLPKKDENVIKKWIKELEFETVLDIGCGNGRMVEWFKDKQYVGVDISKKLIDISKERFPEQDFRVQKVEELGNERFDLVFSYTTLEHITEDTWEDAVKALKKCGRQALIIEPADFESRGYCHSHDYEKDFKVLKKKKLSDKTMYLVDLT